MKNPIEQASGTPTALSGKLKVVVLFADDLIHSQGSTTSMYFDRWCEIERTASGFLSLCKEPWLNDFKPLIEAWISVAIEELTSYYTSDDDAS